MKKKHSLLVIILLLFAALSLASCGAPKQDVQDGESAAQSGQVEAVDNANADANAPAKDEAADQKENEAAPEPAPEAAEKDADKEEASVEKQLIGKWDLAYFDALGERNHFANKQEEIELMGSNYSFELKENSELSFTVDDVVEEGTWTLDGNKIVIETKGDKLAALKLDAIYEDDVIILSLPIIEGEKTYMGFRKK
ncbi:MAG: hypothetical protein Q4E22_04080 [Coriobacteriia bacterium]|nr:hypothetical protein [Coriobacteriia bacterium]